VINDLRHWYETRGSEIEKYGVTCWLTVPSVRTLKQGARLDFKSEKYLAQVVVWETGECIVEFATIDDGPITTQQHEFGSVGELDRVLNKLVEQLH